jgi:cytochrome c oxidase assembly factor 2
MPSVLHPRSRTTLSLFTSTLILSFAVVALPHIIPCPVPHRTRVYADGESPASQNGRKRRRKPCPGENENQTLASNDSARECPVPKPSGLIGQILGFKSKEGQQYPIVTVEKYSGSIRHTSKDSKDS